MLSKKDEIRAKKVIEMARDKSETLEHSAKGTTWKNHKYVKKVGNKYYYDKKDRDVKEEEEDKQLLDLDDIVETPDFEGLADKIDPLRPEFIKKFNNSLIWSPNKEDETLVSKGKDAIDKMFAKHNKRKAAIAKK